MYIVHVEAAPFPPPPSLLLRLDRHKKMLQQNFSRVGGKKVEESEENEESEEKVEESPLVKESESVHTLWATGRHNCDGLLVLVQVCAVRVPTH